MPSSVSFTVTDPNGNTVPGTTSFNSTDTVATFTPSNQLAAGMTYTVTISGAKDSNGDTMLAPYTYTFTTSQSFDAGGKCPCAIWPDVAPSGVSDATDGSNEKLGVKFTAHENGTITGIRFYKVPDNLGTHTGTLWSSTGTLLATGTFTNESTEGWEQLNFSSPVSVTAGTTYVASYHTSAAHYAYTPNGLAVAGHERAADGAGQRRCLRLWHRSARSRQTAARRTTGSTSCTRRLRVPSRRR